MKKNLVLLILFGIIASAQTAYSMHKKKDGESNTFHCTQRTIIDVTFAYDREQSVIFTVPKAACSDRQIKQEIAKRCSIEKDQDNELDHIQKQEGSSPSKIFYIVY